MSAPAVSSRLIKGAQRIRVLIAERSRMANQLLAESLESDSRFQVVAVAPAAELFSLAINHKPDVAVISADFVSTARKGLQIARTLTTHLPSIGIVILLDVPAQDEVIASFRSGATGVFCRTEPVSEFRACVERVSRGEIWTSSIAAQHLLEAMRRSPCYEAIEGKVGMLSKREIQVAEGAAQGQTNKQIAVALRLSEHTVKNYLFRIFEKLGVSNRTELLFFLSAHHKDGVHSLTPLDAAGHTNCLEVYLKAAEEGWVTAQFIVGLAYLEGRGVEKNEHSAFYWLRMAEGHSSELRERSRMLIQELKAKMTLKDVEAMEKSLMARKDEMRVDERTADLIKGNVLKLAG
jgi:DNA-binding NarL/FixJ family response regulator